jgi:hypothetical protein
MEYQIDSMTINKNTRKKIASYLEKCKKLQGFVTYRIEGVNSLFMRRPFRTTYDDEFVCAATELYILLNRRTNRPLKVMSELFLLNGVKSCKGCEMTFNKVKYLYDHFIKYKIK